jgi:membrane-bound metal-dependent hydrolase YbcI (DUF457 family)
MDLFTHVIFAYLLSFVIWGPSNPQYIAAGALAGGLPDGDAFLFLLARRFPMFRHHGITHSIFGVTVVAAVGSFLLPYLPYFPHASTLDYFLAMLIGGLSHTFLDGFTHFAVHPLLPFSNREFHLDADRAINLAMLSLTLITLVTLVEERGRVAFSLWVETAWLLTAIYGGYLLLRGAARWRAGVWRKRGGYTAVSPTGNPFEWLLIEERITPETYHIRWRPILLGKGFTSEERKLDVRKVRDPPGPVLSAQDAIDRSYFASMAASRFMASSYHFGEASVKDDHFEVTWYSIEFGMFGRAPGVRAKVDAKTGKVQVASAFLRAPLSDTA